MFKEYHAEYPDGLQLSSFKRAVREYKFHVKAVGHVEHYAADQMYVDFAGDKLEVVDEMTGQTKKAEVFVAILPFSHYTYCEAVWSQRKEDLIKGCEDAILYFEGAPAAIVPTISRRLSHEATATNPSSMTISPLLPNITTARCSPLAKIIYFFQNSLLIININSSFYSLIVQGTFGIVSFLAKIKSITHAQQQHISIVPDTLAVFFGMDV